MSTKASYVLLIIFFISSSAFANSDYEHCDGPTALYLECLGEAHTKVDDELNKIYKKLKNKTTGNDTLLLVQAQRKWLEFRESECKFFFPKELSTGTSGTFYVSQQLICEITVNRKRIDDLKEYLTWSGCGSCRW